MQIMLIYKNKTRIYLKFAVSAAKSATINFHCWFWSPRGKSAAYQQQKLTCCRFNIRTESMQRFYTACGWDFLKYLPLCCYYNAMQIFRTHKPAAEDLRCVHPASTYPFNSFSFPSVCADRRVWKEKVLLSGSVFPALHYSLPMHRQT